MARTGGVLHVTVDGIVIDVEGAFTLQTAPMKAESFVTANGAHHYTEIPQPVYVEGTIIVTPDTDVPAIQNARNALVIVDLANGQSWTFRNAVQTAEGQISSERGQMPVKFEAESAEPA